MFVAGLWDKQKDRTRCSVFFFTFIRMKNKKVEALIYFLLAVLLAGLACFLYVEFEPAGNTAEFSILNTLSWIGQRTGKMPIVFGVLFVAVYYFFKSIQTQRRNNS